MTTKTGDQAEDANSSGDAVAERIRAAGERARAEAELRRKNAAQQPAMIFPREINGPKGPEPTRYGDWERNGLATDF